MSTESETRLTFSNRHARLIIDPSDLSGRVELADSTDQGWRFDPLAHLGVRVDGVDDVAWSLQGCSPCAVGSGGAEAAISIGDNAYRFRIWLESDAPEVVFEAEPLAEPVPLGALRFPGPMLPVAGPVTDLVLPKMLTNGVLHRPASHDHWACSLNVASHSGLNMPFWGLGSPTQGLLAVLETADDVSLDLEKSVRRSLEASPTWTASLGALRYTRVLRVRLLQRNGYVEMAKAYRDHVVARGRFKTLAEKIEERPLVRQVVGGPYFSVGYLPFSERKFRQITHGLREIGYTNGIIGPISHIQWDSGAWLNDYQPFIDAPHYRQIASEAGFAAFAWLYLEDILAWDRYFDPAWLVRQEDGEPLEGWFNQDYEYSLICSKVLRRVHRLLKERISEYGALHFDTTTAKALTECWDPSHRMSKSEDRESRRARLEEVASWGILIGSEAGYDWAFDVYDFCSSNPRRAMETGLPVPARHIPLLGLVYHDSVVSYGWEYDPYNRSYFGGDWSRDKLLYDVMAGNPPTVSPVMGYFPVIRRPAPPVESRWVSWEDPVTQQLLHDALPVAQLHARTAHQQMVDHAFLDDAGLVTRTVYEDGTSVLVNSSAQEFGAEDGNLALPPRDYAIDGRHRGT